MNPVNFRNWRKALGYSQPEAGEQLGVNRSTIQNWEGGVTPVPLAVHLACPQLTRRWKQRSEFGPVTLVYSSKQLWRAAKVEAGRVFVECELFPSNAAAFRRALRLSQNPDFKSPFIIDQSGKIVLNTSELLCRVRAAKRRMKIETAIPLSDAGTTGLSQMDMWDFKKWRRTLGVSQFEAAEKLGVSRGAIQKWEAERFPIPREAVLACEELTQQLKRDSKYGPVLLFYSDEPFWPEPDCPSHVLSLVREPHNTNEEAIGRTCRLRQAPDFLYAFVVDTDGNMIWSNGELLRECDKVGLAGRQISE